jgi:hypothetical protein
MFPVCRIISATSLLVFLKNIAVSFGAIMQCKAKKRDKVVEGILIDYKIPFVTLDIDNAAKDIVDITIDTLKKNEKV